MSDVHETECLTHKNWHGVMDCAWCMHEEIERLRDFIRRDWPYDAGPLEVVAARDAEIERLRGRLAERLIDYCVCNNCNSPTDGCNCVACTTKRLEAEIERLRGDLDSMIEHNDNQKAEIERLREALRVMRDLLVEYDLHPRMVYEETAYIAKVKETVDEALGE